eukprot:3247063-Rhodomonas_salina.1
MALAAAGSDVNILGGTRDGGIEAFIRVISSLKRLIAGFKKHKIGEWYTLPQYKSICWYKMVSYNTAFVPVLPELLLEQFVL